MEPQTGYSVGDGIIVVALTLGVLGYLLLKFLERRRRLEIVHAERLAAMDKGIPLPELPDYTPSVKSGPPPNPDTELIVGIVLAAFGIGTMMALSMMEEMSAMWPMPLPVAFIGLGLVLYYYLATAGQRSPSAPNRGN